MPAPPTATAKIDAMLAALPRDQRAALQSLREAVAAAAPRAEEAISYGMPAFRYRGKALLAYAGFATHCSLFPMGSEILDAHPAEFADFRTSKGTLQFTPEHPIPGELLDLIVRERMARIDAKADRGTSRGT